MFDWILNTTPKSTPDNHSYVYVSWDKIISQILKKKLWSRDHPLSTCAIFSYQLTSINR